MEAKNIDVGNNNEVSLYLGRLGIRRTICWLGSREGLGLFGLCICGGIMGSGLSIRKISIAFAKIIALFSSEYLGSLV